LAERLLTALTALLVLWPTAVTATDSITLAARGAGMVGLAFLLYRMFTAERVAAAAKSTNEAS
jgi:hypothetical protein